MSAKRLYIIIVVSASAYETEALLDGSGPGRAQWFC